MVYRIFVEKKPGMNPEAESLLSDLRTFLSIGQLTGLRILNRYDVDHMSGPRAWCSPSPKWT